MSQVLEPSPQAICKGRIELVRYGRGRKGDEKRTSLAGGDLEDLGGQADGALGAEVLGLGALDELGADLLKGLDVLAGQSDADLVNLLGDC